MAELTSIPRGWDHLPQIRNTLSELEGGGSLARELIQNADDAGAETLRFVFTDSALNVFDDAGFKSCGHLNDAECPRSAKGKRPCDFHAFNSLGAGTKADDPSLTGAFGVGFLAVYQITDKPEIFSAGVHLHVDEINRQSLQCEGCDEKHIELGTMIRLPWATHASAMRRALNATTVSAATRRELAKQFREEIPEAMLFLNHVRSITVRSGSTTTTYEKTGSRSRVVISAAGREQTWSVLKANFDREAAAVQKSNPQLDGRPARVEIAFRPGHVVRGRLFATLPTQVPTGLQLHINSSFYPRQDRKGIHLDGGPRADWNAFAIDAAARLIAERVEHLARSMGPKSFWRLVRDARQLEGRTDDESRALGRIWTSLREALPSAEVMWTSGDDWEVVSETVLPPPRRELASCLNALGVPIISTEIRSLIPSRSLGLRQIQLPKLVEAMAEHQGQADGTPPAWSSQSRRRALIKLLGRLVAAEDAETRTELKEEICSLRLFECSDGSISSFKDAYVVQPAGAAETFGAFAGDYPLIGWGARASGALAEMADIFTVDVALNHLESADLSNLQADGARKILRWLQSQEIEEDDANRLRKLPLIPTTTGLRTAIETVRPGGFKDELGLIGTLDRSEVRGLDSILAKLEIKRLGFADYVMKRAVPAISDGRIEEPSLVKKFLSQCVIKASQIENDPNLIRALRGTPCIPCRDGELREPEECYFAVAKVRDVLGPDAPLVAGPVAPSTTRGALLTRLGVVQTPRPADVLSRVRDLTARPPTPTSVGAIRSIVHYLRTQIVRIRGDGDFSELRKSAWLPATGNRSQWFRPDELIVSRSKKLVGSNAWVLDLPAKEQERAVPFLDAIGVPGQPPTSLVVDNVIELAGTSSKAPDAILRWLDVRADNDEIQRLRGVRFLPADNGKLVEPGNVFRLRHSLNPRLATLRLGRTRIDRLLDALGVEDKPSGDDAARALREIAGEYANPQVKLPIDDRRFVDACWRVISNSFDSDPTSLRSIRAVIGRDHRLHAPKSRLFDDPELSEHLSQRARDRLITRDHLTAPGLERAGVDPLARRVRIKVDKVRASKEDRRLTSHVLERDRQIARFVRGENGDFARLLGLLKTFEVKRATPLKLKYHVTGMPDATPSRPVPAAAYLDERAATLYVDAMAGGKPDWSEVAKQLRRWLLPDSGLASAMALEAVLDSLDQLDADQFLSGYNYSDLSRSEWAELKEIQASYASVEADEGTERPEEETESSPDREQLQPTKDRSSGRNPSEPKAEEGKSSRELKTQKARQRTRPAKTSKPDERFATYVYHASGEESDLSTTKDGKRLSRMGDAGADLVVAVLQEEVKGEDLSVRKMPDKQKGFDLLVESSDEKPVRYIEVKSTAGEWGKRGVTLSSSQFEKAQEEGDHFWLYVVEHVYESDARIWAIQDPAGRGSYFVYDRGWENLASYNRWVPGAQAQSR